MSVLVTGASGSFGRFVCARLEADAQGPVWRVDRFPGAAGRHRTCDLTGEDDVRRLLADIRPSLILHLAGTFSNNFAQDLAANALGAKHILDATVREEIKARVVLIGSAAEYGLVSPEENPIREDRVLRPVSVYGVTKSFQTQIACYYAHARQADVVVARLFNLFAPGLSERLFVGRVQRQIAQVLRGETREIAVGNLEAQRDYVDVENAAAHVRLIAERGRAGEVYHVASGVPMTMRALLGKMLAEAGLDFSVVRENQIPGGRTGYDVPLIYADMTRTLALAQECPESYPVNCAPC